MKNVFVLILGLFVAFTNYANPYYNGYGNVNVNENFCPSSLELHIPNPAPFKVKIDGNIYNDLFDGSVLRDIPAGKRYLKIVQFRNPRNGHNHHHHNGNRRKVILFEGYINFNECQKVVAFITPNHQLHIRDVINMRPQNGYDNLAVINIPPNQYINNNYINADSFCGNCNNYGCNGACGTANNTPLPPPSCEPNVNYGNNNYYNGPMPMPEGAFANFLRAIEERTFDSQKLNVAELGIEQNYFTTAQIRRITETFTYDNSRLKVAKMAYTKVVDPENYTIIFDVFTFDSSVEKLVEYMRKQS